MKLRQVFIGFLLLITILSSVSPAVMVWTPGVLIGANGFWLGTNKNMNADHIFFNNNPPYVDFGYTYVDSNGISNWDNQTLCDAFWPMANDLAIRYGERYLAFSGIPRNVSFFICKSGLPLGNVNATIRYTANNSIIETSTNVIDASTLPVWPVGGWYTFGFSGTTIISNKNVYVSVEFNNTVSPNDVAVGTHTGAIAGRSSYYYWAGWTALPNNPIDICFNYWGIGTYPGMGNVTFVRNTSSSHVLIERDNHYNLGNYSTNITYDVYAPVGWTPTTRVRIYPNNTAIPDVNSTPDHYIGQYGVNKRYSYIYNPSNTLTLGQMGYFRTDIFVNNCTNGTLYYYGNMTWNNLFEVYILDPPYHNNYFFHQPTMTINLTWTNGNHSDRTVVRRLNSTINPMTPLQGYQVYNGTGTFFNETIAIGDIRSYTAFSYNNTTRSYSEPLFLMWGVMMINVYNASRTWELVSPFGLMIQNQGGDTTYVNPHCHSPLYLNLSITPLGEDTIFVINSTNYQTQTYTRDTRNNTFYNYTFMLPPVTTPGGGGPEENDSHIYLLTVIDQANQPVPDALVVIKIYKNSTDTYEQIYSFLTDGAGQVTPWLTPNVLYQIIITKNGFEDLLNYWTPSSAVFTKTFQLTFSQEVHPTYYWTEQITFNGYLENATSIIHVNYTDALTMTINWTLDIYRIDPNSSALLLVYTVSGVNQTFQLHIPMSNRYDYLVLIQVNHTYFGFHHPVDNFMITGWHPGQPVHHASMRINTAFNLVFGYNPFGWSSTVGIFVILGCFFSFGRRETYMSVILIGAILLVFNIWLGLTLPDWTRLTVGNWGSYGVSVAFSILVMFIGILMIIRDRGMFGSS